MNALTSKKLDSKVAVLALIMLSPVFANAGCIQSDLQGTWYTYAAAMLHCKIKVNSSGSIVASNSKCSIRDETGRYSLNIGGGNLKVSNNCVIVDGKIRLCEDRCTSLTIEHGILERDKNMIILEVYAPVVDPTTSLSLVGAKK